MNDSIRFTIHVYRFLFLELSFNKKAADSLKRSFSWPTFGPTLGRIKEQQAVAFKKTYPLVNIQKAMERSTIFNG